MGALVLIFVLYWLPLVIAGARSHRNGGPIFLTLLIVVPAGFLFIGPVALLGWLVCFIWCFSGNVRVGTA